MLVPTSNSDDHESRAGSLVAESASMKELLQRVRTAARGADCPVLLTGEMGVGKTHLARYIHQLSPRAEKPLVVLDCGGVSELENLLFGHRTGSFTGAVRNLSGRLAAADGGTLVLDDFERLSHRHQDLLHRVVVDGAIVPIGSNQSITADTRVVATTNKDVATEVAQGRLKSDFVSRLDYFEFRVPPLRERPEDLPVLAKELLGRHLSTLRRKGYRNSEGRDPTFHQDCWPALRARRLKDNVRGLEKLIVRLIAAVEDGAWITPNDIERASPSLPGSDRPWFDQPRSLREVRESAEREYIRRILRESDYNAKRAARILGVSTKHLYTKLRQYGIPLPSETRVTGIS